MCEFQTVISSIASFAKLNMEKVFADKIHHRWPFLLLVTSRFQESPVFLFLGPCGACSALAFPALNFYRVYENQYSRYMHKCTH